MTNIVLNRRSMMLGAASAVAMPYIVRAQKLRSATLALPWLAQRATASAFVAESEGFYQNHGLDVAVSRGNGSVAAAQAIAQEEFDCGLISAGPTIRVSARGTPLTPLARTTSRKSLLAWKRPRVCDHCTRRVRAGA